MNKFLFFFFYTFNSHEGPRQNFSLQYQYNIKQTSDENIEKFQLTDYQLIQYQILKINIIRFVWQTVERITYEILEVKGLKGQRNLKDASRCYTHLFSVNMSFGKTISQTCNNLKKYACIIQNQDSSLIKRKGINCKHAKCVSV